MHRELPCNIEAEQLLLGAIIINNNLYVSIEDIISYECFHEILHQQLFKSICQLIEKGISANILSLKSFFKSDKSANAIEGVGEGYVANIVGKANLIVDIEAIAKLLRELYLKRKLIALGEDVVNTAYKNRAEDDALGQIETIESALFKLANYGVSERGHVELATVLKDASQKIKHAYENKSPVQGVSTGFIDIDRMLGGLQNSDLIILAARPSMGKTSLAINIALNACKYLVKSDVSVAFFSLEMSSEQIAARIIAIEYGVNIAQMKNGTIKKEDLDKLMNASKDLGKYKCFIDDSPMLTITSLRNKIRRLYRKNNVGAVFIDYLQLLKGARSGESNRTQEVSEITQGLKAIAKEMNIPIVALSQLSRLVEMREDKKPLLSDLRESGSIEQDADVVLFLYREAYYLMRKQPAEGTESHLEWQEKMSNIENKADIIVAKQRNGPVGMVKLYFDLETTTFRSLSAI